MTIVLLGHRRAYHPLDFPSLADLGLCDLLQTPKGCEISSPSLPISSNVPRGNLNKAVLTTWFPLSVSFIYWIFLTFQFYVPKKATFMYIKLLFFLCTFFSCFQWRDFYIVKDRDMYKLSNKLSNWKTRGFFLHFTWWAALADTGNPPKCLLPQPCTLACSQKLRLGLTASHTGGQPHLPVHMQDSSCGPNTRERLTQPIQGTCASGLHIRRPLHKANSFQSGRYR